MSSAACLVWCFAGMKTGQFLLVRFCHRGRRVRNGRLRDVAGHRRHGRAGPGAVAAAVDSLCAIHDAHGPAGFFLRIDCIPAGLRAVAVFIGLRARIFGRKNVGVLGMFFNLLLLATTLV